MASKHTVTEADFSEFVRCPLRTGSADGTIAPELKAAEAALRGVVQEAFNDVLLPLARIRRSCEAEFDKACESLGISDSTKAYKRGVRLIPRISRRLHDLVVDYLVMHPVSNYTLPFGRNTARGEYCTLTRPMRKNQPLVLRLRFECPQPSSSRAPDIVNMLRWKHFRSWEPTLPLTRVLNYRIDHEVAWKEYYDERTVNRYLNNVAANVADKRVFPSPGGHCDQCQTAACTAATETFDLWTR